MEEGHEAGLVKSNTQEKKKQIGKYQATIAYINSGFKNSSLSTTNLFCDWEHV